MNHSSPSRTRRLTLLLLMLFSVLFLLGNARWLAVDRSTPAWDTARYLVNSLEAFDLLRAPSVAALKQLYFVRNTVRPSLGFVLPTQPFYALFGVSEDVATLWTQGLFWLIIVWSVYGIGERLFGRRVGLLAAALIGLNLEIVKLSRVYWPELGVIAVASLGTYWLLCSEDLHRRRYLVAAGALLGFGLLQRPIFPLLFLAGPLAFVFIRSVTADRGPGETVAGRLLPGLAVFALPVLLIAGPFYITYGQQMLNYVAGFQEAGTFAPVANVNSLASFFWYPANLGYSVSLLFQGLFAVGVVMFGVALARRRLSGSAGILAAWALVPYAVLSLTASKSFSYLAALYPALALMLAWAVVYATRGRRWAQFVAGGAVLAASLLTYAQLTTGAPLSGEADQALHISTRTPVRLVWPNAEIIQKVKQLSQDKPASLGVASAANNLAEPPLAYYARLLAPHVTVIRWSDPIPTLVDADFVVRKTGEVGQVPPRTLEDKNASLVSRLLQNEASVFYTTHQQAGQFKLPDGSQALLYRRVTPRQADEANKIGAELLAAVGDGPDAEALRQQLHLIDQENQMRIAKQLFAEQRYAEALPIFQKIVDAAPKNADAQQGLGRSMFAMGNCDGAVEHQTLGAQLLPINGTYTVLGDILFECKRLDEAVAAYQKAIELDAKEVRTHFVLAQVYMTQSRTDDAIREFNTTIELDTAGEFASRAQNFLRQLQP